MYDIVKNTQDISPEKLNLAFIGFSSEAFGALQYAARFDPSSLSFVNPTALSEHIRTANLRNTLYVNVSESKKIGNREYETMRKYSAGMYDLGQSKQDIGNGRIEQYLIENPPKEYGKRRIQCLHETGRAGANYGIKLLLEESRKVDTKEHIKATVMGYGNVAFGAIDELYRQGIPQIDILTKRTTNPSAIGTYLRNSDIVVNGVEQPAHLRGKNYLVTKEHVQSTIQPGTVIVDLIGGSPTNRCAVETIINCTYPHNPFFVENNVYFTSLWGWPLMGMQRKSVLRYSEQITDVLLSKEKLIKGLITAPKNVKSAIVTNTHQR